MIAADKREYRKGCTRHYAALKVLDDKRIYRRRKIFTAKKFPLKMHRLNWWNSICRSCGE